MATITTATYADEDDSTIKVTYDDASVLFVPVAVGNRHYAEVQAWVGEGNTISAYVAPTPPSYTNAEKLEMVTGLTIAEIKSELGIT